MRHPLVVVALVGIALLAGCGRDAPTADARATPPSPPPHTGPAGIPTAPAATAGASPEPPAPAGTPTTSPAGPPTTAAPTPTATTPGLPPGVVVPASLGTPLPVRPDGYGEVLPTPADLHVRRVPTTDLLPPPPDGAFHATVTDVPADVLARSTWTPDCPVTAEELRHVTVGFWGFDDRPHTGELLVNAAWAEGVADVFRQLFEARFPIEEMRIVSAADVASDAPPTGDGNVTSAFVCRPARQSSTWSQHAHGLAVDVNPFHNPYHRGDLVLPEKASAYLDRTWVRPGMIADGDVVTTAFAELGWGWGGAWSSLVDTMHFSLNGR